MVGNYHQRREAAKAIERRKVLLADWVAPMDRPVLRGTGVAIVSGKIAGVGAARDLRVDFPQAIVEDLGQTILLPGLVNAHAHLELSALSPGERPPSFVDWLKRGVPRTPPDANILQAFVERPLVPLRQRHRLTRLRNLIPQLLDQLQLLANGQTLQLRNFCGSHFPILAPKACGECTNLKALSHRLAPFTVRFPNTTTSPLLEISSAGF